MGETQENTIHYISGVSLLIESALTRTITTAIFFRLNEESPLYRTCDCSDTDGRQISVSAPALSGRENANATETLWAAAYHC